MTAVSQDLPSALGFTASDLEANRRGALNQAQKERMKRIRWRNTLIAAALFLALALGATILFYLGQLNRSLILFGVGAVLAMVNAFTVVRAGRAYMRISDDLRWGQVEVLTGEVERVLRRGRAIDSYLLRINGVELNVSKHVFVSFRHMAPYRLYRAGVSRILLSAESAA